MIDSDPIVYSASSGKFLGGITIANSGVVVTDTSGAAPFTCTVTLTLADTVAAGTYDVGIQIGGVAVLEGSVRFVKDANGNVTPSA